MDRPCRTNVLILGRVAISIVATEITSTTARQIMRKRLVVKLAVSVAVLGTMLLLQGCDQEVDGFVLRTAWSPVGFSPVVGFGFAPSQGAMGGGGGGVAGATGGISAAGAARAGGAGNQVSGGGY